MIVAENVTTGTELIRVVATDADSGESGAFTFSLSGSQVKQHKKWFTYDLYVIILYRMTRSLWIPCLVR